MAAVEGLTVYPVKGLDGVSLEATTVLDGGTLEYDREFALFDADGDVVNGKRTDLVHELDTGYDPETGALAVEAPTGETAEFDLPSESDRAAAWFGDVFDADLTLRRDTETGYVDRRSMGPSVISTATLQTVASWFDGVTVEDARRRLRANIEISGVPAFWEDRFVGEEAPAFTADDVRFDGQTPCGRCVVPQRDPETGDPLPEFRERFVEKRRETFPEWADQDAFDHFYTLMLIASVPQPDRGKTLEVGDSVCVVGG